MRSKISGAVGNFFGIAFCRLDILAGLYGGCQQCRPVDAIDCQRSDPKADGHQYCSECQSYVAVCYGSAAFILWLVVLFLQLPITGYSTQTNAAFWAMALISQVLGHSSYNWALKWFSTGFVAVALLGEPIGGTILAYIIFKEGLTWLKLFGGLFILSAIFIAAVGEKK